MPHPRRQRTDPTEDWRQIQLLAKWPEQITYELLRPVVLFGHSPAARAGETGAAERTLYRQAARFDARGMASLFPPPKPAKHRTLPEHVRHGLPGNSFADGEEQVARAPDGDTARDGHAGRGEVALGVIVFGKPFQGVGQGTEADNVGLSGDGAGESAGECPARQRPHIIRFAREPFAEEGVQPCRIDHHRLVHSVSIQVANGLCHRPRSHNPYSANHDPLGVRLAGTK